MTSFTVHPPKPGQPGTSSCDACPDTYTSRFPDELKRWQREHVAKCGVS